MEASREVSRSPRRLPPCSGVSVLQKSRMSHFWDTHHTKSASVGVDPCEEDGYNIGRDDDEMDNSEADFRVVVDMSGHGSLDCPITLECLCLADHKRTSES